MDKPNYRTYRCTKCGLPCGMTFTSHGTQAHGEVSCDWPAPHEGPCQTTRSHCCDAVALAEVA